MDIESSELTKYMDFDVAPSSLDGLLILTPQNKGPMFYFTGNKKLYKNILKKLKFSHPKN